MNKPKNIIVGLIYRPPNTNIVDFNSYINDLLMSIKCERKLIYLIGDLNINLLNSEKHLLTSEFLDIMYSFSFYPLINKRTRVGNERATLIDNINCNDLEMYHMFNGILYTNISDHFPLFSINFNIKLKVNPAFHSFRIYSPSNIKLFSEKMGLVDWNPILSCSDCQNCFTLFHNQFIKHYEECFPMKLLTSSYKTRKFWLTLGLKTSIKHKNKL